jgi:hypothetical protein
MSESVSLVQGPVAEPVTLNDVKLQLGFGPMQDSDRAASQILNDKLRAFIVAARRWAESWTHRALITQTWVLRRDSFPGHNLRYEWNGYPEIKLPYAPLQSIGSFQYIDVSGTPQILTQDTTFGVNPLNPEYGYQLERGDDQRYGRLLPPFARPWPPTRMVPANVIVKFRCGYGGPITCSMENGSAVLTVSGGAPLTFNNDDQPLLPAETGLPIFVPGAGTASGVNPANGQLVTGGLWTTIASVNPSNGQATLAAAAAASVTNVQGWAGYAVPNEITAAIKMLVESYYEHGGCEDVPIPDVIINLLDSWRNEIT